MKLQYLGDSKDSFKWEYHSRLTSALGADELCLALMMTDNDSTGEGKTRPELFPASDNVIDYCNSLRECKSIGELHRLPVLTGAGYSVKVVDESVRFVHAGRREYFSSLEIRGRQVIFLDPDNGFAPEKSFGEKHLSYEDIQFLTDRMDCGSVISVFHHFRRVSFPDDYAKISEKLDGLYTTAVYWHSLMFVQIAKDRGVIEEVAWVNRNYADNRPVKVLRD